jgi:hypothetical protein
MRLVMVLILSAACLAGTRVGGMRRMIPGFAARIVLEVITALRLHDVCTKGQSGTLVRIDRYMPRASRNILVISLGKPKCSASVSIYRLPLHLQKKLTKVVPMSRDAIIEARAVGFQFTKIQWLTSYVHD